MALAARLSEAHRHTLLLEAGGNRGNIFNSWIVDMPAAYGYAYRNPRLNWAYIGEKEPALGDRRMYQPRGKVLGGSSSINGIGYLRGHPKVFERWVREGAKGWSFDQVLPAYKKLETWHGRPSPLRGMTGPVHVTVGTLDCAYYAAFFEAGQQAGYGFSEDINAERPEGFAVFQANIDRGIRASTAFSYGRYVVDKAHLTVKLNAHALRILVHSDRAIGVEYLQGTTRHSAYAEGEVILSAGTFNSPQILMLSGIGPEAELKRHGIPVIHRLDGVGQNLQDHPIFYPKYQSTLADSPVKHDRLDRKIAAGLRWLLTHGGPAASNQMEALAMLRSDASAPYPDIEFQFCPLILDHDLGGAVKRHGWSNSCGPVCVEGKGWVKLGSADPMAPPRIFCNFLSTQHDIDLMIKAFKLNREVMAQPALASIIRQPLSPGLDARTNGEILDFLRREVAGDYHPAGTCKMGSPHDPLAVVDPELRLLGIDNLRIADASVMPVIVNANTNATSIMIGERAADMILGDRQSTLVRG